MRIRIKFTRSGPVKFLGHLDLMRYFQKAIRRAEIDIKYTEGFSPHQIMSFAAPLGVGVESEGEYFDIEVNSSPPRNEAIDRLNRAMAEGISIVDYAEIPDTAKKAMTVVAAAEYDISLKGETGKYGFKEESKADNGDEGSDDIRKADILFKDKKQLQEIVEELIIKPRSIPIIKKTKKSEKEIDLKSLIYEISVRDSDDKGNICVNMLLSAGSSENIKPQLVMEYICGQKGILFDPGNYRILRKDVYMLKNSSKPGKKRADFVPLNSLSLV